MDLYACRLAGRPFVLGLRPIRLWIAVVLSDWFLLTSIFSLIARYEIHYVSFHEHLPCDMLALDMSLDPIVLVRKLFDCLL